MRSDHAARFYCIHMLLIPGALVALIEPPLSGDQARTTAHRGRKPRSARSFARPRYRPCATPRQHAPRNRPTHAMNQREKSSTSASTRILKVQGKPFFPTRSPRMRRWQCVVMAVIRDVVVLGAESAPRRTRRHTYVPRPEWYFFFLFESSVIKRRASCRSPHRRADDRMILRSCCRLRSRPERRPESRDRCPTSLSQERGAGESRISTERGCRAHDALRLWRDNRKGPQIFVRGSRIHGIG